MITLLGLLAGLLTTGCWFPQLLRSWRTRSTGDISWTYLAALSAGVGLWLLYGCLTADLAIICSNAVTLGALITLAVFKAVFDRDAGRLVPQKTEGADPT
jgi:MtN3 and saliva related transmembrane protein